MNTLTKFRWHMWRLPEAPVAHVVPASLITAAAARLRIMCLSTYVIDAIYVKHNNLCVIYLTEANNEKI